MKPVMIIAGGSGFLGQLLVRYFASSFSIIVLSRSKPHTEGPVTYAQWDGRSAGPWTQYLNGAKVLINLTGRSVDCRYNDHNKKEITESRIESTRILAETIASLPQPPEVWLNAASATIYRHSTDLDMDEINGEIGSGFSVDVCTAWENAFFSANTPATRKVALRTGMVLSGTGGPYRALKALAYCGLGGRHGSGTQFFCWLHESDFLNMVRFLIERDDSSGVYNLCAPAATTNKTFMRLLRHSLHMPVGIPHPTPLLELGAWLLQTETELLLKSRRAIPKRLLDAGYIFRYPDVKGALDHLAWRYGFHLSVPSFLKSARMWKRA